MKKPVTELEIKIPDTGMDNTEHTLVGDYIVFVTIEHDGDCGNPLEDCDGIGTIWSRNSRHNNHKSDDEIRELLEENPDAVKLSYYEHGNCKWDVAGTANYPDAQWDSVSFAGLWVPDDCVKESYTGQDGLTREQWMLKQAQAACDVYTEWCNGNCYGYTVKVFEARYEDGDLYDQPDDYRKAKALCDDSCWGFIGDDVLESAKDAATHALSVIQKAREAQS